MHGLFGQPQTFVGPPDMTGILSYYEDGGVSVTSDNKIALGYTQVPGRPTTLYELTYHQPTDQYTSLRRVTLKPEEIIDPEASISSTQNQEYLSRFLKTRPEEVRTLTPEQDVLEEAYGRVGLSSSPNYLVSRRDLH